MGMDTIEIVRTIDKAFDIEIPDEVAARLVTVGMVADYVTSVTQVRATESGLPVDENQALEKVIEITSDILGIRAELINKNSNFVDDLRVD